jgi:hypothetical protein
MINITKVNNRTTNGYKFLGILYDKKQHEHSILFESIGDDICIEINREDFGDFMTKVVESYGEGVKHLVDEMKKETVQ